MVFLLQVLSAAGLATLVTGASDHHHRKRDALPSFALDYAPHAYLHCQERYWPSDVTTHLQNTGPQVNFTSLASVGSVTLNTLNTYNSSVFLTSDDQPPVSASWAHSDYGKPDNTTGVSGGTGTIIAVEKNETTTDVFYFTFFSYNYGRPVLDINFDEHVGDWEHLMIRFVNSKPYAIYFSQHGAGSAYYWSVPNFVGQHPITFVANGSHANYIKAGDQKYTFAGSIVEDKTDAGYFWDMTQNYRGFWYDNSTGVFTSAGGTGKGGSEEGSEDPSWLQWKGMWGDQQYQGSFPGQYCIFGECHYTSGPTGPVAKNLGRVTVCQDESKDCKIFTSIDDITEQS